MTKVYFLSVQLMLIRDNGRDLTQSYDKSPCAKKMSIAQSANTNNATKKLDYTADRPRRVSWSNYGHPTGVVNLVYGPNLPTPRNSRIIKRKKKENLEGKSFF